MVLKRDVVSGIKSALAKLDGIEKNTKSIISNARELEQRKKEVIDEIIKFCKTPADISLLRSGKDPSGLLKRLKHILAVESRYVQLVLKQYNEYRIYDSLDEDIERVLLHRIPSESKTIHLYFSFFNITANTLYGAICHWYEQTIDEERKVSALSRGLLSRLVNAVIGSSGYASDASPVSRTNKLVADFKLLLKTYQENSRERMNISRRVNGASAELNARTLALLRVLKKSKAALTDIPESEEYLSRRSGYFLRSSSDFFGFGLGFD